MEPLGQCSGREGCGVDPVQRRVADLLHRQFLGDLPPGHAPFGQPTRQPVGLHPVGAEPGRHLALRQSGERPAVVMPRRISRSVSAARSGGEMAGSRASSVIGSGAQNSAEPPRRDDRPAVRGQHRDRQHIGDPDRAFDVKGFDDIDNPFRGGDLGPK